MDAFDQEVKDTRDATTGHYTTAEDAAARPAETVSETAPTRHEAPSTLLDAIKAMNGAIDMFVAARVAVESAARDLEALRVSRLDHLDLDWSEPDHIWLNGFACIRPTDEFAALVVDSEQAAAANEQPGDEVVFAGDGDTIDAEEDEVGLSA